MPGRQGVSGKSRIHGFTLLEMSIVLTLIGVIVGGGLLVLTATLQSSQFNLTMARIGTVQQALVNFAAANDRLPCPGDLTIGVTGTNYGYEAGAGTGSAIAAGTGVCSGTGMLPAATNVAASGTAEGAVPTRALRLSDDYMYDGWGHRLRYAVDPVYTVANSLPVAASCGIGYTANPSAITVEDATDTNTRTNMAAYALVSHGANGHGAYTSAGVMMNTGSTNSDELTNCHCTSAGAAGTYTPTYVEKVPTLDSSTTTDNFDDIVAFKDAWQLQQANFPLASTSCPIIYVTDQNNYRVEKFMGSNYLLGIGAGYQGAGGTIGTSGTGNGQFSVLAFANIVTDASGNVYVQNGNYGRIDKFSSSGAYISTPVNPGVGSGNGEANYTIAMTMDSAGNFYIADTNNNGRIEKFSSSGGYLMTISGDKGDGTHTCTQCSSTTSCTCYNGSGNGQIGGYVTGMAIDSSGNIWITDSSNARVEEFNSSGVWVQNIGSFATQGGGNGQFGNPSGIAFDPNGYLWVADSYNRVQKFSINGSTATWQASLGGTSSACTSCLCTNVSSCPISAGSGNGQLSGPGGIAFDNNGNLYVADGGNNGTNNNRVEVFSNSGTFLYSIGGPSPHTCETSPAASPPACTSGTGSGQFNAPWGLAVGSLSANR